MPSFGWQEMIIVLVIMLIIFGPKRLPEMGRSLGKGIKEFKKSTSEFQEQLTGAEPAATTAGEQQASAIGQEVPANGKAPAGGNTAADGKEQITAAAPGPKPVPDPQDPQSAKSELTKAS